jgi:predicted RNase H-related nuclease YkuK (DUF458 family)
MANPDMYTSPSKGELTLAAVVTELVEYITSDPNSLYRLVIGSDSQRHLYQNKWLTNFVTAIVIHRVSKGGRYFWKNGLIIPTHTLREKIYKETMLSLDVAGQLVPLLTKRLSNHNWELEIHIDVGQKGETREMIQEVVGMVVGSGYRAKTKPDSFAASSVADKHT